MVDKDYYRQYYHDRKDCPTFKEKKKWHSIKNRYGLTRSDVEDMLEEQNHRCAICSRHASEFSRGLYIDHCHKTGKVRGMLCVTCNNFLGGIEDDVSKANRVKEYLNAV